MPKVTFLPINETYDAAKGDSILEVAIANDVPIQHACGGFCACTTCHVHVKSGLENLSGKEDDELERLERVENYADVSRLGCQARIHGDVTVEIQNLEDY